MTSWIKKFIELKINSITLSELMEYSARYGFFITKSQGEEIIKYIQNQSIDPFSHEGRQIIFQDLAKITDEETALQAKNLFKRIIQSYNIDHLFE